MKRHVLTLFAIGVPLLSLGHAHGQTTSGGAVPAFPGKPIHIITGEPGGSNDFASRLIAPGLAERMGQAVIVENKGGASGIVGAELVVKAPPDGYTVLLYGSPIWLLPFMQTLSYDPLRDFLPVTLVIRSPNLLVVHPSVAANSLKELIALAKAKPDALNYASSATGGSPHLAAELFKAMAGVNMVMISYKGAGPAVTATISGEVQVMFPNAASSAPHLKSGKLRALAVTSAQPTELIPGLPTVAASGLPGYEAVSMFGMFAPAKTPPAVINRLNQETARVLARPEVKEKFFNAGVEAVGNSPAEFATAMKTEMTVLGKVIRDAGIRAD
jgi:tripartite-type tricarboxylate transporter receptor subunit TctC